MNRRGAGQRGCAAGAAGRNQLLRPPARSVAMPARGRMAGAREVEGGGETGGGGCEGSGRIEIYTMTRSVTI